MSVTWAKFAWDAREKQWAYCGTTPHDELVAEFEETFAEKGVPTAVVALEEPVLAGERDNG